MKNAEKLIYQVCRDYWEIKINEIFYCNRISGAKPYLNSTFGDGTDFFNGNPIINYHFAKTGKAIRIIQEEPNPKDLEISSWIDKFDTDDIEAKELVISLQLTPHSEKTAFELIKKWIVEDYSSKKMERFIEVKLEKIEFSDYMTEQICLT